MTNKLIAAAKKTCKNFPLRQACCGAVTNFKKLGDRVHKPLYDQMLQRKPGFQKAALYNPIFYRNKLYNFYNALAGNCNSS